ncbi:DUF3488 and DUF4129 domain-containing transglutaminase family protein [Alteribacillus sp. HJP-4]|uniref:transglutaminase TgpA family protein n=1 Tax=Alteribacillus sp. HJP-4 TaxID=2775394 RepID=UPI0035CD3CA5
MFRAERTPGLFFLYMLGYLLLMEWLLPLPEVTDTGYVPVFMVAAFFYFIIMFVRFPWWLSLLMVSGVIIIAVHSIFFDTMILGGEWIALFMEDLNESFSSIGNGDWYALSDMFRSFLFLILLAIMSYLIYFWIVQARRILFFFLFTVIYIGVMDTFLPYDGSSAIIRVVMLGFILLALLQWDRLSLYFPGKKKPAFLLKWIGLTALILAVAAGAGAAAPKAEPQWPDPLPFLESAAGIEGGVGSGPKRIGYGDNDESLGGGFEMDNDPVFSATGDGGGYWRGESKNVYTGQGWESDTEADTDSTASLYEDSVETEELEMDVEMAENRSFDFVFYPGSLTAVAAEAEDLVTEVDQFDGQANTFRNDESYEASSYTVTYEEAAFPIERMRDTSAEDPEEIVDNFLNVPEDLPDSVSELAEELTAGEDNRYDRVRAVEEYLRGPDFTYDTQNVPVPEEDQDYVEQFLFETQTGYCDNFSTSMAVMLRTLDIPTRWVKGFTRGDEVDVSSEQTTYEVTNANAHSWVEVYFPDVGWVPFEPTLGFSSDFDYTFQENTEEDVIEEDTEEEDSEETTEEEEEAPEEEEEDETATSASGGFPFWPLITGAAAIGISLLLLFRGRVIKRVLLYRFKNLDSTESFIKAVNALIFILKRDGISRKDSETLREYAARVDHIYGTEEMSYLTNHYERFIYGRSQEEKDWKDMHASWESMVVRVKS